MWSLRWVFGQRRTWRGSLSGDYRRGLIDDLFDAELDILSDTWNLDKVLKRAGELKDERICDVLLDQAVFAGVGNIIKNEALFMARMHPESVVAEISKEKLEEVAFNARAFAQRFLEVRRRGERLNLYLSIYRKKQCPICHEKVLLKRTGNRARISFFCPSCQVLYA